MDKLVLLKCLHTPSPLFPERPHSIEHTGLHSFPFPLLSINNSQQIIQGDEGACPPDACTAVNYYWGLAGGPAQTEEV